MVNHATRQTDKLIAKAVMHVRKGADLVGI